MQQKGHSVSSKSVFCICSIYIYYISKYLCCHTACVWCFLSLFWLLCFVMLSLHSGLSFNGDDWIKTRMRPLSMSFSLSESSDWQSGPADRKSVIQKPPAAQSSHGGRVWPHQPPAAAKLQSGFAVGPYRVGDEKCCWWVPVIASQRSLWWVVGFYITYGGL